MKHENRNIEQCANMSRAAWVDHQLSEDWFKVPLLGLRHGSCVLAQSAPRTRARANLREAHERRTLFPSPQTLDLGKFPGNVEILLNGNAYCVYLRHAMTLRMTMFKVYVPHPHETNQSVCLLSAERKCLLGEMPQRDRHVWAFFVTHAVSQPHAPFLLVHWHDIRFFMRVIRLSIRSKLSEPESIFPIISLNNKQFFLYPSRGYSHIEVNGSVWATNARTTGLKQKTAGKHEC